MTRRTGLKARPSIGKSGWPLIFFFLRDRLRFRTRSVRNLCRLFRLVMSCQPPAILGNGVVHDHIAWAITRHLRSPALSSAPASRTGARERPSAAKLRPLVAGASGGGQDDQRRLLYANPCCHLAGFWWPGLQRLYALETVVARCLGFQSSSPGPGSSTNSGMARSEPGVRRDAW